MRFAKELEADSIPEWRKMYINYSGLKKRLNAIEKYRRLNHQAENARLEQVIHAYDEGEENPMPNIFRRASEVSPTNRVQFTNNEGKLNRLRSRTGSISTNLLKRFSYRGRRQSNSAETSKLYDGGNSPDLSVLEELLNYVSEPEQAFFKMLDEELTKVSQFYDEKEKEAITKSEALKAQLQIVQDFATQLSEMNVKKNTYSVEARLNPLYWFRRSMPDNISQNEVPILPPTVNYNDSHHMTYKLARSRLKKAITEYYRSLELLKAYRVSST
ncbi:SPX domain-containing protein [Pilobolus umbonatus]|nr:SPX domain-containing protein [Pilobolus umbonatus]